MTELSHIYMANNNTTISRTIKGLITDFHPMQLDDTMYSHALNAVIEDFDGNGFPLIQNEPSNLLCTNFPEIQGVGYKVVGFINVIEQNRVIWFLKHPITGDNEIGETQHFSDCREYAVDGMIKGCDDCAGLKLSEDTPLETLTQRPCCTYATIDNNECFDFDINFPIDSVEYRILDCGLQIFFAQGNNARRWLEFDYVDDDPTKALVIKNDFLDITGYNTAPCEDPIYDIHIDCNRMNLQPDVTTPCITFIDLVSGGSNKAGVYQFFIAFADVHGGKRTSYVSSTNPIPIWTKAVTFETDYVTDRAIALSIDNLDPTGPYRFYKLAVAKTINGFTSFYEVGTFPVTQTHIHYTGNEEAEIKLTEGDIFQRVPYYKSANSVTASNNILFWAGLKEFSKPNLQRVANDIVLNWQTIAIPEAVYRNPRNANKFRGYMRDEVYPFGIVFIYGNGEESPVYHIPGRAATEDDLDLVTGDDVIVEDNCDDCQPPIIPNLPAKINSPLKFGPLSLNEEDCPCGGVPIDLCTLVGGTGYVDGTNIATTGGTGIGLTVDITTAAGIVLTVAINAPGAGYTLGDIITITGGGVDATFEICELNSPTLVLDNSNQDSCSLTPVNVLATAQNILANPPFVDAGFDQIVPYLGAINLLGTVTPVAPNTITNITWTLLTGPGSVIINNPAAAITFFTGYDTGTYTFELAATDSAGSIITDTVVFTVTVPANVAPICDPGPDKIVIQPDTISYLNGNGSSDLDGIVSYAWSNVSGPVVPVISNIALPYTAVTGLSAVGTYVFELVVTDARGCTSTAQTIIYVVEDTCDSAPCCANLLYPINGTTTSSTTVSLGWSTVLCADSYDIYMEIDGEGFAFVANTTDTSYVLYGLLTNTTYNWYVVPTNTAGDAINCDDCYRTFTTPDTIVTTTCEKARWQVYNTATLDGGNEDIYKECEETCFQYGKFAYWESTERYPNNPIIWGDLCGEPIRHHKFPDSLITHIHDKESDTEDYSINNIVYPIGVKVDHDSIVASIAAQVAANIISAEEAARIVGYRIVRGNRFRNKSVVAKGLLFDVNQYRRKLDGDFFDNQDIFFPNYPYNDLSANPFITDDFANYDDHNTPIGADLPFITSKRYTFHSPDTHFSEPTIGTKIKLETAEYGQSEGYFTKAKKQARQKFLSNTAYSIALAAGIVSALVKHNPEEVGEYTAKGNIISAMGVAAGTLGPFLPFVAGPGATFAPNLLVDSALYPGLAAGLGTSTEFTRRTIQGKYNDWRNPVFLAIKHPWLLPLLPIMLLSTITDFLSRVLAEAKIILDLFESFTPYRDWSAQYHSVGKYNCYTTVANSGNKIRRIISSAYLQGDNTLITDPSETIPDQFDTTKFNNWHRESSVYLKYSGVDFPDAGTSSGVTDNSRFTLEDGAVNCKFDLRVRKSISSYYAAIKNNVPDQYGNIFNIDYLPTDSCIFDIATDNADCRGVYGGDTFINRFALKTKVPYFLADTFMLPDGTDFNYELYANLGVPRHYYNSTLGIGSEVNDIMDILGIFTPQGAATFLGRPKSIRDCQTNKFFYQNGYIYVYHYGVPYFLVESDVNVDYRHAENMKEKAFYPIQSDLDYWLQQENVNISEDNVYSYNSVYSKQNKETPLIVDPIDFEPSRTCRSSHPNRIIYATDANWLTYKANDYFDVPLNKGQVISINGVENETVIIRSVNGTSIFKAFNLIPTDGDSIQVGTGGVFKNKPQQFAETTLGYIGSQHKAILHTEFGHILVDAKRGQVFNIENGIKDITEISKDGMKNWFKENLPFRVLKDFKNMPEDHIDNAFNGIGLCMAFDKRFNRFILTKRDYKLKDKSVLYDVDTRTFYTVTDAAINEQQSLVATGGTSGNFTLTFNGYTTAAIAYNATAAAVRNALLLLPNIEPADINCTGGPLPTVPVLINFTGQYAGINVSTLSVVDNIVNGTATITTPQQGTPEVRSTISVTSKRYFKDASWTLSYNFFTKSWVSYHSYKPNYYINFIEFFGSGIDSGLWLHDLTNASYQVFYGKLYPFEVEPITKFGTLRTLNSMMFDTEVRRNQNEFDYVVKSKLPGFNKAVIYNDLYNTGVLELINTNKNNLGNVGKYPIRNVDNWEIEVSPSDYQWRFNQFYNLLRDGSEIPQWIFEANNTEKKLNAAAFYYKKPDFSLARMKGQWFKTRFINDKLSNYKIISKFSTNNLTTSIR